LPEALSALRTRVEVLAKPKALASELGSVEAPAVVRLEEAKSASRSAGERDEYPDLYPYGYDECARNIELAPISSDPVRVLAVGDAHDHPEIKDKRRFTCMGRQARVRDTIGS
jgi:hypothetical protein